MSDAPPQQPRQPKLRSSCDECGVAKLKCDRGYPQCGRCITLGLDCVYGVSRKMGKPRRDRVRAAAATDVTHGTDDQASDLDRSRSSGAVCSNEGAGAMGDGLAMDPELHPGVNNIPLSWSAFDGSAANILEGGDAVDPSSTGLLGLPPPDLMSVDLNHDLFRTFDLPEMKGHSIPSIKARTSLAPVTGNMTSTDALSATFSSDHDCAPDAYGILISLSSPSSNPAQGLSLPPYAQPASKVGNSHQVPVDQILRLNREASDRLGRLLNCSCSRRPHLALLYSSIISLILTLYQQAAGCLQVDPVMDTASCPLSSCGSLSGSPSPWTSTSDGRRLGNPAVNGTMTLGPEPSQMMMGSFRVDDQDVRAALTIQLVLGEIKRAGHLIDLLTSRSSSGTDEVPVDGVDSLYRNLTCWFKREHSSIVENLKARLEEIGP